MTPELTVLALAVLLQAAQFVAFAIPANLELGSGYTMSARDRPPSRPMSERTLRLQRALNNHFEGLLLFAIAVMLVTLSDQSTTVTVACAWTYLLARILYVPAYVFGWRPGRSLIWMLGFTATVWMVISTLI